jgi:eukaryotic-like serine/threonine-protein kinase
MVISPGTALGPYEIETQLGAGGMGEVYRARDTRLGRTVAIKILPTHLSGDPIRKQRFEREAKIISSLNHPHICVLYDIGHCDGAEYLVMECVEGETLANRLKKGPLPLVQVLKYGTEIADALDKAHRSGVVHRDLKPGNIMLTATGAKLLDFGLAKPFHTSSGMTLTSAITQSTPVTADGAIVGTFQYMSPEQVEGREVDGRSDIFSLGAVLYEMLTGKQAFSGKSHLSVASAILESQPQSPSALKPLTPKALEHAIRRCLEKDREDRWQTPRDLGQELKWVAASGEQEAGVSAASSRRSKRKLVWLVLGVLAAATLAAAVWWRIDKPTSQTMYYFAPLPFPARDMAISPNGHTVAIVAYQESVRKNVLWIYDLGSLGARSMTDTTGATYPFWSPDGAFVGFFADGRLKKLEIANGQVHVICDAASGRGGTWNRNNVIVFTPMAAGGLYRVPATGGTPTPIDRPDASRGEETHRWPAFLPDGQHYLYLAANFSGRTGVDAIFAGSLDSNEKRFIVEATANAAYAQPGYLLFCQGRTLFAQRFDAKSLMLRGQPTAILAEIQTVPQVSGAVFVATNQDVVLAQTGSGLPLSQPIWFDRKGNETGDVGKPDIYSNVSLVS